MDDEDRYWASAPAVNSGGSTNWLDALVTLGNTGQNAYNNQRRTDLELAIAKKNAKGTKIPAAVIIGVVVLVLVIVLALFRRKS